MSQTSQSVLVIKRQYRYQYYVDAGKTKHHNNLRFNQTLIILIEPIPVQQHSKSNIHPLASNALAREHAACMCIPTSYTIRCMQIDAPLAHPSVILPVMALHELYFAVSTSCVQSRSTFQTLAAFYTPTGVGDIVHVIRKE